MKRRFTSIVLIMCTIGFALTCAACAPKPQAGATDQPAAEGQGGIAGVQIEWSPESDCSICHTTQNTSMTESACLASTHASEGTTCIDCHQDASALGAVHEGATNDKAADVKRLKKTKVGNELCLSCHVQSEIVAATETSAALTDSNGTVVNPHAMPENEDHAKTTCSNCHTMHIAESIDEEAATYCLSCHHQGVYECGTCHE